MKKLLIIITLLLFICNTSFSQSGWQWVTPYPTGQPIYSLSFINANTGVGVTTYGGTIIWTTNGGTNWSSFVPFNKSYFGCLMLDENTAFAGQVDDYYPCDIIRTTNKGLNWHIVFITNNVIVDFS